MESSRNDYVRKNLEHIDKNKSAVEIFQLFRSYANHEDSLINTRLSWFLTLNSFIFASISLLMSSKNTYFSEFLVMSFIIGLSIIGLISAATAYYSVSAAFSAIKSIKDLWIAKYEISSINSMDILDPNLDNNIKKDIEKNRRYDPYFALPYMKGGGPRYGIAAYGRIIPVALIVVIGFFWLLTIIFITYFGNISVIIVS